jgi:hypothetical protein
MRLLSSARIYCDDDAFERDRTQRLALWHDDPALVFEPEPGQFLRRTATLGHEGFLFYFTYAKEKAWVDELERHKLRPCGSGEAAYREQVPIPGRVGGDEWPPR